MACAISEETSKVLKMLITHLTSIEEHTTSFKKLEKRVFDVVINSDSMSFKSRDEVDKIMESLSDKFLLHGFRKHANFLLILYHKFMDELPSCYEDSLKRSIIRFIVAMSESPTANIYDIDKNNSLVSDQAEVNWPEYLQEGIPRWSPTFEKSDSEWSFESGSDSDILCGDEVITHNNNNLCLPLFNHDFECKKPHEIYMESREKLTENVQSQWFNKEIVRHKPSSDDKEANIEFLWEDHIDKITGGLINNNKITILSEYKVIREIIWQIYEPTNSAFFEFCGNKLIVKKGVSIASIRENCFETVVSKFLPYIETIQSLKQFQKTAQKINSNFLENFESQPDTFRHYASALDDIFQPLFEKVQKIEKVVSNQESVSTLLRLFESLKPIFETFQLVKTIHDEVIISFENNSNLRCATFLITKLYQKLDNSSSTLEQNIVTTLFLSSLKNYFYFVESWIYRDTFTDVANEFVLYAFDEKNPFSVDYRLKEIDDSLINNDIIKYFSSVILQIGRDVKLLRLLTKSELEKLLPEMSLRCNTLFDEYVDNILVEISKYFDTNDRKLQDTDLDSFNREDKKYFELQNLDDLVDTSDGFLMEAFKPYFIKNCESKVFHESIYTRICRTLQKFCPIQMIVRIELHKLFYQKFNNCGNLVKNILISDHDLEKQLTLIKKLFLFKDDFIFRFYRKFFDQIDNTSQINHVELTTLLQDILMDLYPQFCDNCSVGLKPNWKLCDDSLKMCTLLKIHYKISWPINLIIQEQHLEMYRDIFQFILKIKWSLFTLNHLYFMDLEPSSQTRKNPKNKHDFNVKSNLKIFRFLLVNDLSSVQHYIMGHVYSDCEEKFKHDFENSHNFETVYKAHDTFISCLHKKCIEFRDYQDNKHGFFMLLFLVKKIDSMWKDCNNISILNLEKYMDLGKHSHMVIQKLITEEQPFM